MWALKMVRREARNNNDDEEEDEEKHVEEEDKQYLFNVIIANTLANDAPFYLIQLYKFKFQIFISSLMNTNLS